MHEFRPFTPRRYDDASCLAPIEIITPDDGYYIHTFFDVSPVSPSGRYVAALRIPFQDRVPTHEDSAAVCVIDRRTSSIAEIGRTGAWGTQVGAHVCWGKDDTELFYNVKRGREVFAVRRNALTGSREEFTGPVYMPTLDGRYLLSPNLAVINYSQEGYGATMDPALNIMPETDIDARDGLWRTDTRTGERKLIFSIRQAVDLLPDPAPFTGGRYVFFHTKVNPQQDRVMQVVRYVKDDGSQLRFIFTCDLDGGRARLALPYEMWLDGSHHPDWHPDGRRIHMNINLKELRFCLIGDGPRTFEIFCPHLRGSGHPAFSPDGRYLSTDCYVGEGGFTDGRGRVPVRVIDAATGEHRELCRVWTLAGSGVANANRCDPHPAWSRDGRELCFNGAPYGKKLLMIADMTKFPAKGGDRP